MKVIKRRFLVTFFLGLATIAVPVYATSANELQLLLPDSYFIKEECNLLKIRTSGIPSTQDINQSLERLCKNYESGKISGDKWLEEITPIMQRLKQMTSTQIALHQKGRSFLCERSSQNSHCPSGTPLRARTTSTEATPALDVDTTTETTPGLAGLSVAQAEPTAPTETTSTATRSTPTVTEPAPVNELTDTRTFVTPSPPPLHSLELASAVLVANHKPIPKDYQMYALFLFPSTEWEEKNKQGDIQSLYNHFKKFGEAIGTKNAAIWFSINSVINNVDVRRSKFYCDKFNLDYNNGPYVVITHKRPDEIKIDDEVFVIKLSGISIPRIVSILNILEPDLKKQESIKRRKLLFEEVKQRVFTVADKFDLELNLGIVNIRSK